MQTNERWNDEKCFEYCKDLLITLGAKPESISLDRTDIYNSVYGICDDGHMIGTGFGNHAC